MINTLRIIYKLMIFKLFDNEIYFVKVGRNHITEIYELNFDNMNLKYDCLTILNLIIYQLKETFDFPQILIIIDILIFFLFLIKFIFILLINNSLIVLNFIRFYLYIL
jgi:hypothetical protein